MSEIGEIIMHTNVNGLAGSSHSNEGHTIDSGLACTALALNLLELPSDAKEIRRIVGTYELFTVSDIIRAVRESGAKADQQKTTWERLIKLRFPLIAVCKEQRFVLVAGAEENKILIRDPLQSGTLVLTREEFEAQWEGVVVLVANASQKSSEATKFGFKWFLPGLFRQRGLLTQVLCASFFVQIFGLITPLFTMVIIDKVLSTGGMSTLDVLVFGLIIITAFDFIIGAFRGFLFRHMTNRVDVELVARLFRHMSRLPMSYFSSRKTGDTAARARELETIRNFLTGPALTSMTDFLFTFVFLIVMYVFSPLLMVMVMISIGLLLLLYGGLAPKLKNRLQKKFEANTDSQSYLVEVISGMETVKAMSVEPQFQRQWEDLVVGHTRQAKDSENLSNIIGLISGTINKLTVAICLWVGAKLVISGDMTAGGLIAFNMMVGRVLAPAMRIAQVFQQIQQAKVSVNRVGDIINSQVEPASGSSVENLPALRGNVRFEDVSFSYGPESPCVVEDISFDVRAGEIVGIVGSSGSGKSTLMKLLQRLYTPQKGRILADGINVSQVEPSWLRRQIGVVLQESILFNRSIRDNIALTDPSLSIEKVEYAARLAGADEFIRALPQAYDTIVGERGATLSAGQRQRIALARALVGNPRILIFDEATSALDYESERIIQHNMRKICQGRTVFIVAHRLSTVRIADRILTVEKGRIVEDGPHKVLLASNGRFAQLHAMQEGQV
ncbi:MULTISPECIES: peptidase domain-containing ABC transporter [unclassified Maridesulfovibrio]|uniref:peptidase domain-containing ABC transporter n=1 Tax=unclassified Maridesulfovibrio TaxID=2794999 RepID=UPI003B3CEE0D